MNAMMLWGEKGRGRWYWPLGLWMSEQILASILLGAIPALAVRFVSALTLERISWTHSSGPMACSLQYAVMLGKDCQIGSFGLRKECLFVFAVSVLLTLGRLRRIRRHGELGRTVGKRS